MGARIWWSGLLAAATLSATGAAGAADRYAIHEHKLVPADSFTPGEDLTSGDLTEDSEDADSRFLDAHAAEALGWTNPFLAQELFPRIAAGSTFAYTHDRDRGTNGFAQRTDLELYWLQARIPALQTRDSKIVSGDAVNLDLLLPWKIDDAMRLGLLLGSDVGIADGGFHGLRYQAMYGVTAGFLDVQARGGYGLERSSNAGTAIPEVDGAMPNQPRQSELLYGGVLGARWAEWGRFAVEANGAHLVDARADLLSLAPGIRLMCGPRRAAEVGLAGLLDFDRPTGGSWGLRGGGGLANFRYNFL